MQAVYQVKTDCAIGYNRESRLWESVDITMPIKSVLDTYFLLEVGVVDVDTDGSEYTFFPQYHLADLKNFAGTLQEWFTSIAGTRITTLKKALPELKFGEAHYQALDYSFVPMTHLCPPNTHFTQDFAIDDASDIVIEVPTEHRQTYSKSVLYNIGGMWVPHLLDSTGVRLPNAGTIAKRCSEVSVGMWVFDQIGAVSTLPITADMLFKLDTTRDWYSNLLLKIAGGLEGKSVGIVIGGILRWLKPNQIISNSALSISLPNFSLINSLLATREYFDWDDLGFGDFSSPTSVSLLRNPETLKALLLHYSSFLVIVDNPYLEFRTRGLETTGPVGKFYFKDKDGNSPMGMLQHANGRCIHFWPIWEEGEWVLHTSEKQEENYLFGTSKWHGHGMVNDALHHLEPYKRPEVTLVNIRARVS